MYRLLLYGQLILTLKALLLETMFAQAQMVRAAEFTFLANREACLKNRFLRWKAVQ